MKPKLKNGFIQIACGKPENDILTALASAGLNGNELSIVLLVIRKTWGWRKNWDHISVSQFAKITGITKRVVIKNISRLVLKRVLVSKKTLGKVSEYAFNERFAEWTGAKIITGAKNDTRAKTMSKLVLNLAPTKDNTKDTIKERGKLSIYDLTDIHFQQIAQKYSVPISFVRSEYDDMINWHESSGKQKKDWIATLRGFVKRDSFKLRKEHNEHSKLIVSEI